ncbi:hypothetical protein [Arthrobacter sp. AD-310]
MARYSEPTNRQVEMARALLFLSETKKALHSLNIRDAVLKLDVDSNIRNQDPGRSVYHVHATRGLLRITAPEGRAVHPITDTPYTLARLLASDARKAAQQQQETEAAATQKPAAA